ncbi:unnamed protein product [Nippostrongylus brasiliensis]|uniref:Uncharacterized protein n=1 Tax=Nippostrongylus brasiliensis TaxID=27835 RepID=A0A0N4XKG9_NIPBR|nr:unnamed protein product [Nippostrongylus brasiliensis]
MCSIDVRRSLRGVSTVTTHFDDGFSDLAGVPSASQPVPPTLNEIHQSGVGSVQRSGIASGAPLKHDVECAHPYFNVHAISKGGDARMMATRTG